MTACQAIRLRRDEVRSIKETAAEAFGPGTRVILFGSRVDPHKKGGDIDLYIIPACRDHLLDRQLRFLARLKLRIGDRKIDVVIQEDPQRLVEQEAITTGVEL